MSSEKRNYLCLWRKYGISTNHCKYPTTNNGSHVLKSQFKNNVPILNWSIGIIDDMLV